MHSSHNWEDISHHGSPSYECMWCGSKDSDVGACGICPKREEAQRRLAANKEAEDRREYVRLLADHKRLMELHKKYGDGSLLFYEGAGLATLRESVTS